MSQVTEVVAAERPPLSRTAALGRDYAITVAVAVVVFVVAYANGGFSESTRGILGIGIWWVVILAIAFGFAPLVRLPAAAFVPVGLLAAFGLWTLLSTGWASDSAGAYSEFTRVALFVGVFVLTAIGSTRGNASRWVDGLALGLVGVVVVALVSRFFPGTFSERDLPRLLPSGATRLAFPVGYWNGLAILVALALPLLLRRAVVNGSPVVRGLAVAPIPAVACVIYLASSRTGVATALVGGVLFLVLTARRWAAAGAVVVAGAASAAAVLALAGRAELVDGPLSSAAAASQGKSAALVIAGICILAGLLYGVGAKVMADTRPPGRAAGWAVVAVVVVAAVAALVAAHPVRRFEAFKNPVLEGGAIETHLLSSSGNGRWQLWTAAIREFESKPVLGHGAGSYQAWWLEHGSLPLFVEDAHSLYAEVLGELGIVGFLFLVGAFVSGLVIAVRRLLRAELGERVTLASVISAFVAFAVAAAADWMWELTIVPVVAFVCLALAVGPATAATRPRLVRADAGVGVRELLGRYGVGAAVLIAGWLLICAMAVPFLSNLRIKESQAAAGRGDLRAAIIAAGDARAIQPWSAEPKLQLALLEEQAGNYRSARRWVVRAIDSSPDDWRLWLTRARFEAVLGSVKAAKRSLARAKSLNPNSPLFSG